MKQSIYQKLFLSRSTKTIVVAATVVLWLAVTFAASFVVYKVESKRISDQVKLRQAVNEEMLISVFQGYAKFGDLVNSRGTIIELGKPLGLLKFEICKDSKSVPPKPFNDICSELTDGYKVFLSQEEYELFFVWGKGAEGEIVRVIEILLLTGFMSLILVTLIVIFFLKVFKSRLSYIAEQISRVDSVEKIEHFKLDVQELKPITGAIRDLFEVAEKYSDEIAVLKTEQIKVDIARQVAHDIRSPLSALYVAVTRLARGTTEYDLITAAAKRIKSIADDLLRTTESNSKNQDGGLSQNETADSTLVNLTETVREIVLEKKVLFLGVLSLDVPDDPAFFVSGNRIQIGRILSNLLNNAMEAFNPIFPESEITIFLRKYQSAIVLSICDNGAGISPEILKLIGEKGATFGKSSGSGLGLFHAKEYMHKICGDFEIQSQLGRGTIVTLKFPF